MKIDKIYYWNEAAQRYLLCVWSEDFECYLPDLKTKYEKINQKIFRD